MSETDSFIDEVTEEVRRDRLFAMFRKYGWIGILGVLLIVGGAAWNEWQKARAEAAAQSFGDKVAAALANNEPAARETALTGIEAGGPGRAVVLAFLASAEAEKAGDKDKAVATLKTIADNGGLSQTYRQLAELKMVMIAGDSMNAGERDTILSSLASPGGTYRTLAMEQQALIMVGAGKVDEGAKLLSQIREDAEATQSQKARIDQILATLGVTTTEG